MESWKLAFLIGLGAQVPLAMGQVKAFEGAEGFGADAKGIRGNLNAASIFHVTNLNDSGTGSFRDAVSAGNRMIVFDVAGIITLNSAVSVDKSNLYIAGQTAPGNISFYGDKVSFSGANNLIARHFAVRKGEEGVREDASGLSRGSNMIFDHMSITWGVDETFSMNPTSGDTIDNITVQKSIIGQGLNRLGHSAGGLMTIGEGNRFSIIKSIFADSVTRNPKVRGENEFINNVVYGYESNGYIMGDTGATSHANAEGNYFIHGVNTRYDFQANGGAGGNITINPGDPFTSGSASFFMYGRDNWVDEDRDGVLDGTEITSYPGATVVATRHAFPTVASMTAQEAVAYVIRNAGMSVIRDAVDQRIVDEVASYGTLGGVINRDSDLFPNYATDAKYLNPRARLVDADNDGMPDNWEVARGLNPNLNSATEWRALNLAGYTRIEEYVNELGADGETILSAGGNWSNAATWGGAAPTLADSAVVTGNLSVSGGNAFARRIAVGGNLTITGGTLDVFDTAQVDGTLSLAGGTATFGRILLSSAGTNAALTLGGGSVVQTGPIANGGGAALLTFDGGTFKALGAPNVGVATVVAAGGGTINTNGYSGTISGGLSGAGTLTKTGAGTLVLGGDNRNFSGPISLNAGAITLATVVPTGASASVTSSTGTITAANGTTVNVASSSSTTPLALANGATVTLAAGGITYGGTITGAAGSTLVVSTTSTGNFSIGGAMSAFAGTFDLAASTGNVRLNQGGSALANFDLGDATGAIRTAFDGTANLGSLAGGAGTKLTGSTNGTGSTVFSIGANGNSTTFAGTIGNGTSGTPSVVSLVKTGAGSLALTNAASTYAGVTTINGGTLSASVLANGGANSSIGASSNAAANLVLNGGTLRYTGGTLTTDRAFTLGAGGGAIERNGAGNFALGSTADVVMAGTGSRTLTLSGTSTSFNNFALGLADPAGGALSVVKDGAGTWRLAGNAKTYSGDTTVAAGSLYTINNGVLPNGVGKGNFNLNAGTLDLYGYTNGVNGLNGAGTVTTTLGNSITFTVGNGNANGTFAGRLTNAVGSTQSLALRKVGLGTQTLGGTSDYAGSTSVNEGTLLVNGALTGTGALTVAANATLGGNGSIAGAVTVSANGKLAPGNGPGTLDTGSLTLSGGADLLVELNGNAAGAGHDQVNVAGAVSLANADLVASLGYAPSVGDKLFVVRNDGVDAVTGQFAGLADGAQLALTSSNGQSYAFQIRYAGDADLGLTAGGNDVVLTNLGLAPEPGCLAAIAAAATFGFGRRRRHSGR